MRRDVLGGITKVINKHFFIYDIIEQKTICFAKQFDWIYPLLLPIIHKNISTQFTLS